MSNKRRPKIKRIELTPEQLANICEVLDGFDYVIKRDLRGIEEKLIDLLNNAGATNMEALKDYVATVMGYIVERVLKGTPHAIKAFFGFQELVEGMKEEEEKEN